MTVEQLIRQLAQCRKRIKVLRDDNQRLWESREEWKRRHAEKARENTEVRRQFTRLKQSRDMWKARAPRLRPAPWKNIHLSERDLERILEMPCRD